jgi:hypothetical protein
MVAIEPGIFVNEALLANLRLVPMRQTTNTLMAE